MTAFIKSASLAFLCLLSFVPATQARSVMDLFKKAGGGVRDIPRGIRQDLTIYVVNEKLLSEYGLIESNAESKEATSDATEQLIGGSALVSSSGPSRTYGTPEEERAMDNLRRQMVTSPGPTVDYINWSQGRKAANEALYLKTENLMAEANGKPLTLAESSRLAGELNAVQNDAVTQRMVEANQATETRAKIAAEKQRFFEREDSSEQVDAAKRQFYGR